jgi:hypothetical protein
VDDKPEGISIDDCATFCANAQGGISPTFYFSLSTFDPILGPSICTCGNALANTATVAANNNCNSPCDFGIGPRPYCGSADGNYVSVFASV